MTLWLPEVDSVCVDLPKNAGFICKIGRSALPKVQRFKMVRSLFRLCLTLATVAIPQAAWAQSEGSVNGRVIVMEAGNRQARDVAQAVVWLESSRRFPVRGGAVRMIMAGKEFQPHLVVATTGTSVTFPNEDPFNHNAFSRTRMGEFDLGLYGRGDNRSTTFPVAGIYRIYCNVHAGMSAFAVIRDNPYYSRPSTDGSFEIGNVPPGVYTIVAWHERGGETRQNIDVSDAGATGLQLQLDARGFQPATHLNKYGKPYRRRGRRY